MYQRIILVDPISDVSLSLSAGALMFVLASCGQQAFWLILAKHGQSLLTAIFQTYCMISSSLNMSTYNCKT
jgi:hypothetical protein